MTTFLGISACGPRGGAVLLDGSHVHSWAAEPDRAVAPSAVNSRAARACLERAGRSASSVDWVVIAGKPLRGFERFIETELALAPGSYASFKKRLPWWSASGLFAARALDADLGLKGKRYIYVPAHEAHLAAAHYTCADSETALLALDEGDWCAVALGAGSGSKLRTLAQAQFPHSPGLLHAALLAYLGLSAQDERTFEAWAVQGQPTHRDALLNKVARVAEDGALHIDAELLDGEALNLEALAERLGLAARHPLDAVQAQHFDLAASWAQCLEEILVRSARHLRTLAPARTLAVSGGAWVRNRLGGRFLAECGFESVHLAPAADGLATALGAALFARHALLDETRTPVDCTATPESPSAWDALATRVGLHGSPCSDAQRDEAGLQTLLGGGSVAWCYGGAEVSPEALSTRCVLALPTSLDDHGLRAAQRALAGFGTSGLPIVCALADEAHSLFCASTSAAFDGLQEAQLQSTRARVRVHLVNPSRQPQLAQLLSQVRAARGTSLVCSESLQLAAAQHGTSTEGLLRLYLAARMDLLVSDRRLWRRAEQPAVVHAQHHEQDPALSTAWACPACQGVLTRAGQQAQCSNCGKQYVRDEGIWRFFHPHEPMQGDVTEAVKAFYEKQPFPHYDERESVQTLLTKSRRGIYARLLDEQIPHDATVLEVGCGTGQLSNFLGIGARRVTGADLCLNSLRLAEGFRSSQGLDNVRFVQMNLFKPAFATGAFDVVMCNGVLHHTADPYGGFVGIARLVKPGGHIVIGLYNQYGRLLLDARRKVFQATGGRMRWIDGYLRTTKMSRDKQESWFNDQYRHPHESKHTMGEVLEWFDKNGFDFVHGVPPLSPWEDFTTEERLFEPASPGNALERGLAQTKMIISGSREGGFYIMIGKKRGAA